MSVSVNRARRAQRPRTARMATVATEVITGKCQNSHTMVAADRASIAKSAATFVRERDDSDMPASPPIDATNSLASFIQGALLDDHTAKTPRKP